MKKRMITLALSACILLSDMGVANAATFADTCKTEESTVAVEAQKDLDDVVDEVDGTIQLDTSNDTIVFSEEDIADICKDMDMDLINEFYSEMGMEPVTADELADMFVEGIENLNAELAEGDMEILENGTIVDSEDDSYYLQGGSTYDQTFWWGRRRYKSTKNANKWARDLQNCAALNAGAATLAGACFGGVGAVPNGLTSAYCWALGNEVSYKNSLTKRGIKADIYWWLVYSVKTQ